MILGISTGVLLSERLAGIDDDDRGRGAGTGRGIGIGIETTGLIGTVGTTVMVTLFQRPPISPVVYRLLFL